MATSPKSCLPGGLLVLLLQLPWIRAAPFEVVAPAEPVLALVGEDAELPCRLSPNVSAAHMELRWFRGTFSPAVLVFVDGREQDREQTAEFHGRATLVADGIPEGRATLRIRGVRVSDAGQYQCLFREDRHTAEATVQLRVAALGSDPVVHTEVQASGEIRLQCSSTGWYPAPQAQWRTPTGEELPATQEASSPDADGLFAVATSVVLGDSSLRNVSCHIQNPLLGQQKEEGVLLPAPVRPRLAPWVLAVAVTLVVLGLLTIGSMFFIWRLYKERPRETEKGFGPQERLLEELRWKTASLHAVDVTLDPDTAHPHLFLYEDAKSVRLEDTRQRLPEKKKWPCVLGREAFTSGRHFWEVEVGDRTDWAVGVCRENVAKKGFDPMTPENGFWAVELYGNGYWALTPLRTPLPLAGAPPRVGVFLDYESGAVSFYNTEDGSHIYTFPQGSFSGPLRPFFCLWSCGKKPLTICPVAGGPVGVSVTATAPDLSKEMALCPLGEDPASASVDTLHSKLIPTHPSPVTP
ncbi:butyrophilin subfamily 1 member A1 [Tupaia chinensis]|uniref:butyrophilin subfamily 1 member A1 n=1 Tax=Tupaia chinensis TaxID=246437 RepID=UPI0003C90CD3|nr:butyrophilin subfamily 1 member A1 [Tupaia chinensis]